MFEKQPRSAYKAGIGPHRSTEYRFATDFLRGKAMVYDDAPERCVLMAEPHVAAMKSMDTAPGRKSRTGLCPTFNQARVSTLSLGYYKSLEVMGDYITRLEGFYRAVLSDKGAEQRILRDEAGTLRLHPTEEETQKSFSEAFKLARHVEVFAALREGKPLPQEQIVGRIFRSLAEALGVEYYVSEETDVLDDYKRKAVTFTYEGIAMFRFEDQGEGRPVNLVRMNYAGHDRYLAAFEGPASYENMQRHVFNWLIDAMREITPEQVAAESDFATFSERLQDAAGRFYGAMKADEGYRPTKGGAAVLRLVK